METQSLRKKTTDNPHILNIAPPLNMDAQCFSPHLAYALSKYGMSTCVLGLAEELRRQGVAVNLPVGATCAKGRQLVPVRSQRKTAKEPR